MELNVTAVEQDCHNKGALKNNNNNKNNNNSSSSSSSSSNFHAMHVTAVFLSDSYIVTDMYPAMMIRGTHTPISDVN